MKEALISAPMHLPPLSISPVAPAPRVYLCCVCRFYSLILGFYVPRASHCVAGNAMVGVTRTPPFTLPFNISAMLFFMCSGATRSFTLGTRVPALPDRPTGAYLHAWNTEVRRRCFLLAGGGKRRMLPCL